MLELGCENATVGKNGLKAVLRGCGFLIGSRQQLLQPVVRKVPSCTGAFRVEGRVAAAAPHGHKLIMVSKNTFDCLCFRRSMLNSYSMLNSLSMLNS